MNGLLTGAAERGEATDTPLKSVAGIGNPHHFLNNGQTALVADALGAPWQGDYVFNTGDVVLDMLHNFFLECGARMGKLRVYESTDNPIARAMCGYLLFVRGGVSHQVAYAKALKELTGVEVEKMLNIPNISNETIPEAKKFNDEGSHHTLYRFSPDDYRDIDKIWKGTRPRTGASLPHRRGRAAQGGTGQPARRRAAGLQPGYHPGRAEIAKRLMKDA